VQNAFPQHLSADVAVVTRTLPAPIHETSSDRVGEILVAGERLHVPGRVYFPENAPDPGLSAQQRLILACIYTRHHDGHVRQRALERIVDTCEPWIAPYVVQLLGEYVVEVIRIIEERLPESYSATYGAFLDENPRFAFLTRQRAVSYWSCYYRRDYPKREDYPALKVIAKLESWKRSRREQDHR